ANFNDHLVAHSTKVPFGLSPTAIGADEPRRLEDLSRGQQAVAALAVEDPQGAQGARSELTGATERPMAFKWTKASRAKLSRSQKARWKERKRQQRRKRAKRSSR